MYQPSKASSCAIQVLPSRDRAGRRQIVAKIQLGEADAAVDYTTDVTSTIAEQFIRKAVPEEVHMIATYPIAVTKGHKRAGGEAFVGFVLSDPARDILSNWSCPRLRLQLQPSPVA